MSHDISQEVVHPAKRKRGARSRSLVLPVIGWREWVCLPDLGVPAVKAKVDTGARSSALHAFNLEHITRDSRSRVRFLVHPLQRNRTRIVQVEAELVGEKRVRNSGGREELRPLIRTPIELLGQRWDIEITLTRRDLMGFRMLLGRQAIRERFLVHPGISFRNGKPEKGFTRIQTKSAR